MKKISIIISLLLAAFAGTLYAQDCATGYCPATITVHHKAGSISPVTGDITYDVTKVMSAASTYKCFITRNLGASVVAAQAGGTAQYPADGWYWQWNRKQGFNAGTTSTFIQPSAAAGWQMTISDASDWLPANDPCTLLLGSSWHIPTSTEWNYMLNGGTPSWLWSNVNYSTGSPMKLYDSGYIVQSGYATLPGGSVWVYWSSTSASATAANSAYSTGSNSGFGVGNYANKSNVGEPVRCLRSY